MGGFFGITSKNDCVADLFYGTDYHSHLGTMRGGLAVMDAGKCTRFIHDITNSQFRSKFTDDLDKLDGNSGIGVISDYEDQPLIIRSHLGDYAIVTVGVINNLDTLVRQAFKKKNTHFSEMGCGDINPTELVATLINQADNFADGIRHAQEQVEGSCSMLLLTRDGIYAARDRFGRTPVVIGRKAGAMVAALENCSFPNLDIRTEKFLGPGEVVRLTPDGAEQLKPPMPKLKICAFLWIYYGYPSSDYEGINVEAARNRCGAALAAADNIEIDLVAGIPDSGTAHAVGYANAKGVPYLRPFVKYTPTWPRSFMPQNQKVRDLVARMKLLPIRDFIAGKRMLFCEDSIVRGTQLQDIIQRIFDLGAREIHMRPACPPLIFGCKYLNFSRSRSELDLAARRAIKELEGEAAPNLHEYAETCSGKHCAMIEIIRKRLNLTSLKYLEMDDMIRAIGMPADQVCTYCWSGRE